MRRGWKKAVCGEEGKIRCVPGECVRMVMLRVKLLEIGTRVGLLDTWAGKSELSLCES